MKFFLSWADFSNFNDAVEVAAPGVDVLSTVPYLESRTFVVDGTSYAAQHVEYSAYTTASGQVVDGGLCTPLAHGLARSSCANAVISASMTR